MLVDYGLLTAEDADLLGKMLDRVAAKFKPAVILEIGVREGQTSRAIARHMGDRPFQFIGIDSGQDGLPLVAPFPGAELVPGDSAEVFDELPPILHLVLIDGCHCVNHVILDFLHYGSRVPPGGIVVFHDTGVQMQGKDYQNHGPRTPAFHVDTMRGIRMLDLEGDQRWDPVAYSDGTDWGGALAYERLG